MDGQTIRVTRRRLLSGTTDWNLFGEEADEHLAQANSETVADAAGISEDRAEEWITSAQSQAESATLETRSLTENDDLLFYDSGAEPVSRSAFVLTFRILVDREATADSVALNGMPIGEQMECVARIEPGQSAACADGCED
ncbi:hypothetical protein [Halalkalicoccus salilacus]|uniref:hypothetical protein n=1 Tax=Halalkalicoccus TaxID=332246 RepID=UPI002F96A23C